jgi:hypothetical protein
MVVRGARKQRRHVALRASLGVGFQILTARIHQGHDGSRELLAEDERRAHRQRGRDIGPKSPPQAAPDLDQKRKQHRDGRDCPSPIGPGARVPRRWKPNQKRFRPRNRNEEGRMGASDG